MNVLAEFKKVTTFIFDVDGVLTDSSVFCLENRLQLRRMNIKDGLGLQMAMKNGFRVLAISGAHSEPVIHRLKKLGLTELDMSVLNKKQFVSDYIGANK